MRARVFVVPLLFLSLFATACGRLNDDEPGSGGIDHPTGADDLVLRVDVGGGLVPIEYDLRRTPTWSLYGDGRIVTQGPQIEIYPGPALPNLLVTRITEDGVQAILAAAREAGLMDGDASYGYNCVADAPTTTFTLSAEGATHVVSAYALGFDEGQCPDTEVEARGKLAAFQAELGDLGSFLPEGSVGAEERFAFDELRVYVQPYVADPNLEEPAVDWPIGGSLASLGTSLTDLADTRCGVIAGDDLATLSPAAQGANELTPWRSRGAEYRLLFRPLLPDEHGC